MKLKRLVSAILAVGMALTMLPTAAFAADTSKYVTDLNFEANGQPVLEGKTTEVSNSSSPANPTYKATNSTWSWSYSGGSYKLDFVNNTIFNPINGSPETVPCAVRNSGTIEGGNFEQTVFNLSTGVIKVDTSLKLRDVLHITVTANPLAAEWLPADIFTLIFPMKVSGAVLVQSLMAALSMVK